MAEPFSRRRLAQAWASHLHRLGKEGPPWGYELTGTFTGPTGDFAAVGTARDLARYLAKRLHQHVQIMLTVEWTARGQPHVHALIQFMDDPAAKLHTRTIEAAWSYAHRTAGLARVHVYDAANDYESYMTKYGREVREAWGCPHETGCKRRECLSPIWK